VRRNAWTAKLVRVEPHQDLQKESAEEVWGRVLWFNEIIFKELVAR
jgi:hypothetical protein